MAAREPTEVFRSLRQGWIVLAVAIVAIPVVGALLRYEAQREGWLTLEQGIVITVTLNVLLALGVAFLGFRWLRAAYADLESSHGELRRHAERLEETTRAMRVAAAERKAFFDHNLDMMAIVGFDGRFKDMNPAWTSTLGHPLDAMMGRPFLDFVHPDDVARTQAEAGRLSSTGQPIPFENRYRRSDGTYAWLRWTSTTSPELQVFLATAKDVTAERAAQLALQRAEARFRTLFEANPVALALSRADARGLLDINPAYERLLGYGRAEALDPSFSVASMWASAARRDEVFALLRRQGGADGLELELRRKDGRTRTVVASIRGLELDGVPAYVIALQDVTEAREAERAASRARERFARVFEASPVAIGLTREDGRIDDANAAFCRLTGYTREELTAPGFSARDLYEDPEERDRIVLGLREAGLVRDREVTLRRKDDARIPVLISLEFIDLGGNTTILSLFQDISEIKRAQRERESRIATEAELERLRRTDQFRAEFINNTAHELSTPMTPLLLALASLRQDVQGHSAALRHLAMVERSAERLRRVVDDMVSAADLQARAITLDRARLDLGRQLAAAVAAHQEAAHRANLTLELGPDPGLAVAADEQRLQLVLGHLLGNAIKFTPAGGRVQVTAAEHEGHARVAVTDTGIGLTSRQIEGLWKPYAQAHDKSQRTDSGAGLGLFVAKGIVDLHGGMVGVSSPGPGRGSTFWFTLPLAPGQVNPLRKRAAGPPPPEPRRNLNPSVREGAEDV